MLVLHQIMWVLHHNIGSASVTLVLQQVMLVGIILCLCFIRLCWWCIRLCWWKSGYVGSSSGYVGAASDYVGGHKVMLVVY